MKKYILYIVFFLLFINTNAQEKIENITIDDTQIEQQKFDKNELENYRNSEEFQYNVVKNEPNILERFWNWLKRNVIKFLNWLFDDIKPAVGILKLIWEILPYVILGIALYFILKFFLRMNTSNSELDDSKLASIYATNEEELINSKNLKQLIEDAIEAKEYRLAIRFYYLFVLKKLSDKELIIWQQEKTNEDYVAEISNENLKPDFTKSTRLYDFVWYGNFDINETEFQKAEILFKSLTSKIIV